MCLKTTVAEPTQLKNTDFWARRADIMGFKGAPGLPTITHLRLFSKYLKNLRKAQDISGKPGLILGATKQTIDWCRDSGLDITVMDFCEPIVRLFREIHHDWQGFEIIHDDWLYSTQKDNSYSWVAGDCVVTAIGTEQNTALLMEQIRRLMPPEGLMILRHFIRPFPTPSAEDIFKEAESGQIRLFSTFRHRLAQSLQTSIRNGISTHEVYKAIHKNEETYKDQHKVSPWSAEHIKSLSAYNVEGTIFCYPTLEELRGLTDAGFEELDICYGDYEMAELCPTIVCRTRTTGL